jgi:hypothetical protein
MPLQLERRWQFVETFIEHLHNAIIAAIERDFANPDRAPRFNLNGRVRCNNFGSAYPSKTFPHAFKDSRPIVAPLVLIIVRDKIGRGIPVSVFDRTKRILGVQPDLMLRPPEPDKIQSNTNGQRQPTIESSTKRNRHSRGLFFEESGQLAGWIGYGFLKDGSAGSFTDWSRSQPSFSSVMCSIAIALALASRSGRISYSETQQR